MRGGPVGVKMMLPPQYGHGSREMVLALRRGHDFERSPHGFCHGWQNGSPGTLKSGSRRRYGQRSRFSCSGAGETHLFPIGIMDSATSGVRPFIFFDSLVFTFFQVAAEAAAGRGSPPPPRAGVVSVWVETGGESCFFATQREREEREGADKVQLPSPRPPGPPRSRGMAKMGGPVGCVEMMLSL